MSTKPAGERLLSLDAFRGATIAGMILVNNSGDYANTWWPLLHQPWHGWTPTDLIFPFFLWMAGMSLVFSRRIGFRAAAVALGEAGPPRPSRQLHDRRLRPAPALGRCPAADRPLLPRRVGGEALALAARTGRPRRPSARRLLGGHDARRRARGVRARTSSRETNLSAQVDRIVLSGHLYRWTKTWDPEGVLSTFPAIATALLGLLTGQWLRSSREPRPKAAGFVVGGLVLFVLGIAVGRGRAGLAALPGQQEPLEPVLRRC